MTLKSSKLAYFGAVPVRLASDNSHSVSTFDIIGKETDQDNFVEPPDEVFAPGDILKSSSSSRPNQKRTLWLGDLECADCFADEDYVRNHMFFEFQYCIRNIRICKDRVSGQPSYGFIEFSSQKQAQYVLDHMNGRFVPGRSHKYKMNWANFNLTEKSDNRMTYSNPPVLNSTKIEEEKPTRRTNGNPCNGESFSIWVGSLDPATTREDIEDLFLQQYKSVCFVKVITDPSTGLGRGFAFVHFRDETESERALIEMNGATCRGRKIRVNRSNTKNSSKPSFISNGVTQQIPSSVQHNTVFPSSGTFLATDTNTQNALSKLYMASAAQARQIASRYCGGCVPTKRKRGVLENGEPTRVIIRGLDVQCSDEQLRAHLEAFGEILQIKIVAGKKATVSFAEPNAAMNAVLYMNGGFIGGQKVLLELFNQENTSEDSYTASKSSNISMIQHEKNYKSIATARSDEVEGTSDASHGFISSNQFENTMQMTSMPINYSYMPYSKETTPNPDLYGGFQISSCYPYSTMTPLSGCNTKLQIHNHHFRLDSLGKHLYILKNRNVVDETGFFSDTDPSMIPAELLPRNMFSMKGMVESGTMERHIFDAIFCCDVKVDIRNQGIECFDIRDEVSAAFTFMRVRQKNKTHKRKSGDHLREEDYETLYASTFFQDWDF